MVRTTGRIAAAALLLTATPAAAESWRLSGRSADGPGASVFLIDMDSIEREGDHVRFTTQSVYRSTTESRDFDRSIIERVGNCALGASIIVRGIYHRGNTVLDDNRWPGDIIKHSPGSLMESTLQVACGRIAPEGPVVANPQMHKWFD